MWKMYGHWLRSWGYNKGISITFISISLNTQLIGTDISECMIKYANEKFSDEKRLQFEVLNIETKNLPKKYISEFDHIFSINALQWCSDIQQALENIYQMLRPNGTIFLNIIAFQDLFEVLKILARDIRFEHYMQDMGKISPYQESENPRRVKRSSSKYRVYRSSLQSSAVVLFR